MIEINNTQMAWLSSIYKTKSNVACSVLGKLATLSYLTGNLAWLCKLFVCWVTNGRPKVCQNASLGANKRLVPKCILLAMIVFARTQRRYIWKERRQQVLPPSGDLSPYNGLICWRWVRRGHLLLAKWKRFSGPLYFFLTYKNIYLIFYFDMC